MLFGLLRSLQLALMHEAEVLHQEVLMLSMVKIILNYQHQKEQDILSMDGILMKMEMEALLKVELQ